MRKELTELRHTIHENPELSGKEKETTKRLKEFFRHHGITDIETIESGGFLVHFDFGEGPHIVFRSELDALPIKETTRLKYRSRIKGVAHSCGHDGHMTNIAGLGLALKEKPLARGKVTLLYQPAEETGQGACELMKNAHVQKLKPDHIFALHNVPGYALGKVMYTVGSFTPAVTSMVIQLDGSTSHAAEPELGVNPAGVLADLLKHVHSLENNDAQSDDFLLVTTTLVRLGAVAHGTSAGHAKVHFTLRSYHEDKLKRTCQDFEKWIAKLAKQGKLDHKVSYTESFSPTINSKEAMNLFLKGAKASGLSTEKLKRPFRWGEDYGAYTEKWNGAMIGLGSGKDHPPLHASNFNFPDKLIDKAVDLFYNTAKLAIDK